MTFSVAPSWATLASPDIIPVVVEPDTANQEVVYVTAYTSAATTCTVVRAQEGTSGITHTATAWKCGPTAQDFGGSSTDGTISHTTSTKSLPWPLPWGFIGFAEATGVQTGITTSTDVTGLTVTFTAVANRRYKLTAFVNLLQSTNTGNVQVIIADGSNNSQAIGTDTYAAGEYGTTVAIKGSVSPAAGSTTYKVRINTSAGTVGLNQGAGYPTMFLVEDIGPNGAPV